MRARTPTTRARSWTPRGTRRRRRSTSASTRSARRSRPRCSFRIASRRTRSRSTCRRSTRTGRSPTSAPTPPNCRRSTNGRCCRARHVAEPRQLPGRARRLHRAEGARARLSRDRQAEARLRGGSLTEGRHGDDPTNRPTTRSRPRARAPIHDRRVTPRGVLPRQVQMWLMVGLAVVILAIILFTGTSAAAAATAGRRAAGASRRSCRPIASGAIEQQLAADEAREQQARRRRRPPGAPRDDRPARRRARAADPIDRRPASARLSEPLCRQRRAQPASGRSAAVRGTPATARRRRRRRASVAGRRAARAAAGAAALVSRRRRRVAAPRRRRRRPRRRPHRRRPCTPRRADAAETPAPPKETGPIRPAAASQRLLEGTVIETVLLNRLDGTFAGPVECLVTTPVYSHDRQRVLIPAGRPRARRRVARADVGRLAAGRELSPARDAGRPHLQPRPLQGPRSDRRDRPQGQRQPPLPAGLRRVARHRRAVRPGAVRHAQQRRRLRASATRTGRPRARASPRRPAACSIAT